MKSKALLMLIVFSLVLSSFTTVMAASQDERVLQKSPKEDAAVVEKLEGFKTFRHRSLTGNNTLPEGLVIRV